MENINSGKRIQTEGYSCRKRKTKDHTQVKDPAISSRPFAGSYINNHSGKKKGKNKKPQGHQGLYVDSSHFDSSDNNAFRVRILTAKRLP
jgi:hypothetical protein